MKRVITMMILVLAVLTTAMWLNAQQKWVGQIGDSICGLEANHSLGPDGKPLSAKECTLQCIKQGGSYVLISQGKVSKLANADKTQVRVFAGENVEVLDAFKGDQITVSKVTRAAK